MVETIVKVKNPKGLHGRPTGMVVHAAKKYQSKVLLRNGASEADAKSIITIMSLGITGPADITLAADGPDEQEALMELKGLIESIYLED